MSYTGFSPSPGNFTRSQTTPILHQTRRPLAHRRPRRRGSSQRRSNSLDMQPPSPSLQRSNDGSLSVNESGEEIERFAERLDLWKDAKTLSEEDCHRAAMDLVKDYVAIAADEIERVKDELEPNIETYQRRIWRRRLNKESLTTDKAGLTELDEIVDDAAVGRLQRWEQEYQTWRLLEDLLLIRYPETALGSPPIVDLGSDRFSGDGLEFKQLAHTKKDINERLVVLKWLEECSVRSNGDLELIQQELEHRSQQGKALWTSGYMNTRERLKAEKRLRAWTTSTDTLPSILGSDGKSIVQQLDPDAMTRLRHPIDSQDSPFNLSFWLVCFQLLRCGYSMDRLRDWCDHCNENTTAVVIGALIDPRQDPEDPSGVIARYRWRKACLAAATRDGLHPWEAAVFGILGGDLRSVERSCFDWKDLCYAHVNSQILGEYKIHIKNHFGSLLPPERLYSFGEKVPPDANLSLSRTIEAVKDHPAVRAENPAQKPSILIQMSLISNSILQLLIAQGAAIAREASERSNDTHSLQKNLVLRPHKLDYVTAREVSSSPIRKEPDGLRMLAHIFLIFRILSSGSEYDDMPQGWQEIAQYICVAYVQFLFNNQKYLLIPCYLCNLSDELTSYAMVRTMPAIVDHSERVMCINTMTECHMDVIGILVEHVRFALDLFRLSEAPPNGRETKAIQLLEETDDTMWPGKRISCPLEDEPDSNEETVKSCGEWLALISSHWFECFESLLDIAENLLIYGRLQTAIEFASQVSPQNVAKSKLAMSLGEEVDLFLEVNDPMTTLSPSTLDELKPLHQQALKYYQCSQLILVVQALWDWRLAEDKSLSKRMSREEAVQSKQNLHRSIDSLKRAMEPLLSPGFLTLAATDMHILFPVEDAQELFDKHQSRLEGIRGAYLPELILAYNSALQSAGHLISRDYFIVSLELGSAIASNDGIVRCFSEARRMRELVDCLALTSKAMVKVNETKNNSSKKRGKGPKTTGIWDIHT